MAGLNPHPARDPAGHSCGEASPAESTPRLPPGRWCENDAYLYGIDLYHQSYFWEAHEAWEDIWQLTDKVGAEGRFLQGLILNTAAQIKVHAGVMGGARSLSRKSWHHLYFVLDSGACDETGRFMGISLPDLLRELEAHYSPLWEGSDHGALRVSGRPPRLSPS